MNIFKIDSIKYGWFSVYFGKYYLENSNYLSCDAPKLLLCSVINLLHKKSIEEWLCWQDEPGANILNLRIIDEQFELKIYNASKPSDKLDYVGETLKDCIEDCWGSLKLEIPQLVDNIVAEFSLYENGNGLSMYEKHWMEFPKNEYVQLKKYAYKLNEQMGEYDEMFCTTY